VTGTVQGKLGRVKKVVIPVAGLGTRGLPFTKEVPKELLPIIDTPTIHFIVEEVISAGIEQVIFVTSKGKSILEDYFDPSPNLENWLRKRGKEQLAERIRKVGTMCEVISVRQKEPLGLGHAILCARPIINNEMFAVCLGDEIFPAWETRGVEKPVLQGLVETAERLNSSVVGVVEVPRAESSSYGIIDVGDQKLGKEPLRIKRTVEKPSPENAPSSYAIIGRYVFQPSLFDHLREVTPGVGGEIQLTDGMDRVCQNEGLHALLVEHCRYDIGNHFSYLKAQIDAGLRRPELATRIKEYINSLQ
jgi:UTP--glucose-1-phosphate uridylyltransferase